MSGKERDRPQLASAHLWQPASAGRDERSNECQRLSMS